MLAMLGGNFPKAMWEKIPVGAELRLTADLMIEQGDMRGVAFMLQSMPGKKRPFGNVYTPKGFSDLRYVVEFKRQATATPYKFVMRNGDRVKALFRKFALDQIA